MTTRAEVLREVMLTTGTTQSQLSRWSGVRQPSISQTLSGRIEISDAQLDRLLSCMGFGVEVVRRPVAASLTRSERRSWQLHRRVSALLDRPALVRWRPTIDRNLDRLEDNVRGEPHERNLRRWRALLETDDLAALHRALTGVDRAAVEMREVSPLSGVLSEEERRDALAELA